MLRTGLRWISASLVVAAGIAFGLASGGSPAPAPAASALPAIKHVFIIVLENESEATSFGPGAPSPYLAQTLPSMGVFLPNYYAIGHASLDNYIALISGQAPDEQTKADCGTYESFVFAKFVAHEQAEGHGCMYPSNVPNVIEQLTAHGDTWKGYMQSMPRACAHPALGGPDEEPGKAGDEYATRHDPFVYFGGITERNGGSAYCEEHVVNLNALESALSSAATTPNYVWITPDVCSDGHESVCQESKRPAGFAGINEFLENWVPKITSSPAFKENGLLVVTFDEADQTDAGDADSCCGEIAGPNAPLPGGAGPGGGQIGAVLVSPYITPGTTSIVEYNHYSLLASIEDLFGLPDLGMAGVTGLPTFGSDVYNRPSGGTSGTTIGTATTATTTGATTTGTTMGTGTTGATTGTATGVATTGATTSSGTTGATTATTTGTGAATTGTTAGTGATAGTTAGGLTTGAATTGTTASGPTSSTTTSGTTGGPGQAQAGMARAGRASTSDDLANVPVSCAGAIGATCPVKLSLTVIETLRGRKVIAVAAEKTKRTIRLGSKTATLVAGESETLHIQLSGAGQSLLKSHRTLSVDLTASSQAAPGPSMTFSTQVLHFRRAGKKSKK